MNAEQLLTHFDRIADAPDAILRLRRFILDLAVRGKLVEQDPNDEPALELLKRWEEEKEHLVKIGKLRDAKSTVEAPNENFLCQLPLNWSTITISQIAYLRSGIALEHGEEQALGDIPYLKVADLSLTENKKGIITSSRFVSRGRKDVMIESGSIVFPKRGGAIATNRKRRAHVNIVCDSNIMAMKPFVNDILPFLELWFSNLDLWKLNSGTSVPQINNKDIYPLPVLLPPLAEQRRIVAKVDELMTLCDRLEAARTERKTTRDRLTATSLARLNTPDPDPAIFQNHAAFALNNITPLTTRPDQIKALRQTILNLAVRGKLVEQDPEDEPASELLRKIAETRKSLIAERKTKRSRDLPPVEDQEIKFGIPVGWAATRMGIAYDVRDGTHDSPRYVDDGYPLITSKNLSSGYLSFDETKLISEEDYIKISQRSAVAKGDILLAMIGSIGNPVMVDTDQPFVIKNVALLKYFDPSYSDPEFLRFFLLNAANEMKALAGGGLQPFVSLSFLRNYPLAIPPLAEQHRIVAKVDELTGLCDRLEASLVAGDETRGRLIDALLHETLASDENR